MISTFLVCTALLGGSTFWTPGEPTVEEHAFVLPLGDMEKGDMERARMRRASARKIVVFIPGLRAKRIVRHYKEGPIRKMQIKRMKLGSALTLVTRGSARKVFDHLSLDRSGKGTLRVDMQPARTPRKFADTPAAEPRTVGQAAAEQTVEEQPSSHKPLGTKPRLATGSSAMAASGLFGIIIAFLSLLLWFLKSGKKKDTFDSSIDVVAVRPFGGKHKLALIETCGEKLLLAASEKGVTLLSHVGNHLVPEQGAPLESGFGDFSIPDLGPVPQPSAMETQVAQEAASPVDEALGRPSQNDMAALANTDSLKMATAKINSGSLSKDLEGLVKLREKRSQKAQSAVNGLAAHLTNRYRNSGAAA